ncbi:MAG: UDP-N-acetylmuramoyl-L-alanyl-D-glutamate--2,6-diaminopimelate ligase [Acidimicrobiales bacterium]
MRLERLLSGVGLHAVIGNISDVEITAICYDSRRAGPGSLFCCLPGAHHDGHEFAAEAVGRGAVALLCEHPVDLVPGAAGGAPSGAPPLVEPPVPEIVVASVRPAMARLAAAFYGRPAERLQVIGVTGTNAKTTVTHLLARIFEAAGQAVATIGTLSGERTTPESPELQGALASMLEEGVSTVAMEVSSHALVQHRADDIVFGAAVFTNLSQDHLDYHGTMERYFQAKSLLFEDDRARLAVVNLDDSYGRRIAAARRGPVQGYRLADADDLELGPTGSRFRFGGQVMSINLIGRLNVYNALAAARTAMAMGVGPSIVAEGLAAARPAKGRLDRIEHDGGFEVLIDYAHTPAALEAALAASRLAVTGGGRVIVVFGCGGDRDRAKRPLMGAAASKGAEVCIVTSDNPRSEEPGSIIADVLGGIVAGAQMEVEVDRATAIASAIELARPGDVVLIAGRGHEAMQVTAAGPVPFDDRAVTMEALAARGRDGGAGA